MWKKSWAKEKNKDALQYENRGTRTQVRKLFRKQVFVYLDQLIFLLPSNDFSCSHLILMKQSF